MGDVLATCGSGYGHVWEGLLARVGGVMGARVLGGALTTCRRCSGHMCEVLLPRAGTGVATCGRLHGLVGVVRSTCGIRPVHM